MNKAIMKKIILVRGIQGSGKTTFAKQWVEEKPLERVRLNYDDIRRMLGKYWVPEREPLVREIFYRGLTSAMEKGYDIVIDNMNLNPKTEKEINTIKNEDYVVEFKDFKTPLEICIERDSKRDTPIGEKVIRQTYERYKSFYNE